MTIETAVLLVWIGVWGLVQVMTVSVYSKYMDRAMNLLEKVVDGTMRVYEKMYEDD